MIFAFALRVYHVNINPPALSWDEVSIGYNAYSILKTGKDEHGRFLPLDTFIGYGDYKPPLAVYITVPFIALIGLNDLAVRLPSSLFGGLTVLATFFLVKELCNLGKEKLPSEWLALVTCAILAFSPWHINLSRGGFEANIALFFVVIGVWLILSCRAHPERWTIAWLPFVATIYTFNSTRYFSIFFGMILVAFMYQEIQKHGKQFFIGGIIAFIAILPILPHLLSPEARIRFNEVNIFTDPSVVKLSNERIERDGGSFLSKMVNNRRVGYARSFLVHFLDNVQPDFLFVKGDGNPKFSIQDVGQLYLFEAPFFAIGMVALFMEAPSLAALLLLWIIAAIIPAATARETPHALRILDSLPTWHIYVAFGIYYVCRFFKKIMEKREILYKFFVGSIIVLYGFGISYYLHNYYVHYPREFSGEWQYGYREALRRIAGISARYDKIVMTDSIGRPYMYTLFYTKTDPNILLKTKNAAFDDAGFYHVYGFSKYRFGGILPDTLEAKTLYIWDAGTVPQGAHVIDTIRLLNGNPVLVLFDNGSATP